MCDGDSASCLIDYTIGCLKIHFEAAFFISYSPKRNSQVFHNYSQNLPGLYIARILVLLAL